MKVLYVTGMYSTKYGGMERFIIELLKQGVTLSVVYNNRPQPEAYFQDLKRLGAGAYVVHGNIFQRSCETYRIIRREKPDIVHYHFGFIVYFLFLLVRLRYPRMKQILTQHCEYRYTSFIMKLVTRICYRSLDLVISVSKGVKAGLIEKIGDSPRFVVSYLGVDRSEIQNKNLKCDLGIPDGCLVLTSIGFDIEVKGFDILARSVSLLKEERRLPDFKIIIVGLNAFENDKFGALVKNLDVAEYFVSVGIRNDVDDFLSITDIYLQPSRTEAISLSIMEALQYGIPVIGTDVGGISEVCVPNYNGLLVQRENAKELARTILRLLTDDTLRTQLGSNSLNLAKNFKRSVNVDRLIALYRGLLKGSRLK